MRTVRSLVILSVVALGGVACRSETPRQSTADTTAAKAAAGAAPAPPPPFIGKGYWNSGAILFASAPPAAGSKTATVELAADIAPGAYTVTCLLHPFMESSLQVVAPDGARLSLAEVAATADKELGVAKADATGVAVPAQVPVGNGATVAAGWGDKLVAVNRYSPETVSIKVGQTVTWRTVSPYMPHP